MLTSTYQLSCEENEKAPSADPENHYFGRMNRKRLEAESLRDAMLTVNGSLDPKLGGNPLNAIGGAANATPAQMRGPSRTDILLSRRRSIYLPVFPGNLNELFEVFDFPHGLAGKRYVTTAPTQALFLMNGEFILAESRDWAAKLLAETGKSESELIAEVYSRAFAREPRAEETARALKFIDGFGKSLAQVEPNATKRHQKSWEAFCQAIFESTEFRFVE
jgi:hypothetical protein